MPLNERSRQGEEKKNAMCVYGELVREPPSLVVRSPGAVLCALVYGYGVCCEFGTSAFGGFRERYYTLLKLFHKQVDVTTKKSN